MSVQVYYFSREYPQYTGGQSEFDDKLRFRVSYPNGTIASGWTSVNALHDFFDTGRYPGGNYLAADRVIRFDSLTGTEGSWIEVRAVAMNVSDAFLGSGVAIVIDCRIIDLDIEGVSEGAETNPGGFVCLNDDDDNNNNVPDKDESGPITGEDDLIVLSASVADGLTGTVTLSAPAGGTRIRVYENSNRSGLIGLARSWSVDQLPSKFYVEGVSGSAQTADVTIRLKFGGRGTVCEDKIKLTVIDAELEPVTSGTDPVPVNPAIVAPVDIGLDNGTIFEEGNKFELTRLQPNIDLTTLDVSWVFEVSGGSIDHNMVVVVDPDKRGARLDFPLISFGNFGTGRMLFVLGTPAPGTIPADCASVDTLVRNSVLDIEQKDFRFGVKVHLCTDGAGNSTSRTEASVRTIMSSVTKILSQCGIIVTTSQVVTTQVNPNYLDLDSNSLLELFGLFDTDEDEIDIDVYFVKTIDMPQGQVCGFTAGVASSPTNSGPIAEGGIAIADKACGGTGIGQKTVRTLAHEILHYLLNHQDPSNDHVMDPNNLMYDTSSNSKRDIVENQCLELRANFGVD